MSGYEGKVKHLAFDHTSRWLATAGGHDACLWDCAGAGPEGRTPAMLPHESPVCAVAFQRSHGLLATAAQDGTVMLWSPERKQPLRATVRMPHAPTRLAWSPDDRLLAIGSEKGVVYVLKSEAPRRASNSRVPSSRLLRSTDAHRHGAQRHLVRPDLEIASVSGP